MNLKKNQKRVYVITGILQICIGLGAIPSGISLIIDPNGGILRLPLELIYNSPFQTYVIPGVILFVVNGLGSILGAIFSLRKHHLAGIITTCLGVALLIWMFCQLYWIGIITWIQPIYLFLGMIELMLGIYLVKKGHDF